MKKIFALIPMVALTVGLALTGLAASTTDAFAGVTVERVGVYNSACSCTEPTLKVNGGLVALGTNGLTSGIALSERDALAWAESTYGTTAKSAVVGGGGNGAGPDGLVGTADDVGPSGGGSW